MAIEEMKGVVIEVIVIGIAGIGTGKAYGLRNRVRIACTTGVVSERPETVVVFAFTIYFPGGTVMPT